MKPLKKYDIFSYGIGDFGINLHFQMINFFFAYFLTDIFGIPLFHVMILLLVSRVIDAITDPIMGYIADHTDTRWGKYRPYVCIGAIPLGIILASLFTVPDLSQNLKLVYIYIFYIMHGIIFTIVGMPYSSISAVITQDEQERALVSTVRMFFAVIVGMTIIGTCTIPIKDLFESDQDGFFAVAVIYALVAAVLLIFSGTSAKERVRVKKDKFKFKEIFPIVSKNKALLVLSLAMFLNTSVWVVGNAVGVYYFKYVLENESLYSVFWKWMFPANLLGLILTPILTKKFGKKALFMFGSVVVSIGYFARHFVPLDNLGLFIGISMVGSVTMMFCSITQWGMVPDTVEYGQWKTGIRSEAIPIGFFSFTFKLAMALGVAFTIFYLDINGYVANQDLSEQTLGAVKFLFNILPGIFSIGCFFSLFYYVLDRKTYNKILAELNEVKTSEST